MAWEDIVKTQMRFKGNKGHNFETPDVEFDNYDSKNNGWPEDGTCIVKWSFSFGERGYGMREVGFHVSEIILQSDDSDNPEITIKVYEDFEYDWEVEFTDKIWPSQIDIHGERNGKPLIEVM